MVLGLLVGIVSYGYDFSLPNADGVVIYYTYINDGTEVVVSPPGKGDAPYSGSINIPAEITIRNRTKKVTGIGVHAFY